MHSAWSDHGNLWSPPLRVPRFTERSRIAHIVATKSTEKHLTLNIDLWEKNRWQTKDSQNNDHTINAHHHYYLWSVPCASILHADAADEQPSRCGHQWRLTDRVSNVSAHQPIDSTNLFSGVIWAIFKRKMGSIAVDASVANDRNDFIPFGAALFFLIRVDPPKRNRWMLLLFFCQRDAHINYYFAQPNTRPLCNVQSHGYSNKANYIFTRYRTQIKR